MAACAWVNGRREWWRFTEGLALAEVGLEVVALGALRSAHGGRAVLRHGRFRTRAWKLTARGGRRVAMTVARMDQGSLSAISPDFAIAS